MCLDNEKIISLLFGILGGKIVSQYPYINQDCRLNRDVLHDLFPFEKRNDSERPMSLYFINRKNMLKRYLTGMYFLQVNRQLHALEVHLTLKGTHLFSSGRNTGTNVSCLSSSVFI